MSGRSPNCAIVRACQGSAVQRQGGKSLLDPLHHGLVTRLAGTTKATHELLLAHELGQIPHFGYQIAFLEPGGKRVAQAQLPGRAGHSELAQTRTRAVSRQIDEGKTTAASGIIQFLVQTDHVRQRAARGGCECR